MSRGCDGRDIGVASIPVKPLIVLADSAFHARQSDPSNLKICPGGTWNDRMMVETVLSMQWHGL